MQLNRRDFVAKAPVAAAGVIGAIGASAPGAFAGPDSPPTRGELGDSLYPSHDPEMVRDMVGASHGRLGRVRELLSQHPTLAKSAWDWGFGDWETALGAASHTGQREIAALLIEHGARPNIFTFAMLGQLDVVRAIVQANPGIQRLHGPHGITLLRHAQAGGEQAAAVTEYLTELGDADLGYPAVALSDDWFKRYLGEYSFGQRPRDRFAVVKVRGGLNIRRGEDGTPRRLIHLGDHSFHPAGAPRVAIRFKVEGEAVAALIITDGSSRLTAARI